MNRVEELIQQLCPNGVEWKKLGEVCDYEQPAKYIVKSTNYNPQFQTPVLTAGQSFVLGYTDEAYGIYKANTQHPVIIFDDFTTSFQWVDFDFKVKSSAIKILMPSCESVLLRFVYYLMQTIHFEAVEHTRYWISRYSQIEIPVPPLSIQQEIVRILDTFTELTANLQTELDARKKQYAYYRDCLLNFEGVDGVEWKKLGEISVIVRGASPRPINNFLTSGSEGVNWIKIGDTKAGVKYITETKEKITKEGASKSRYVKKGDFILSNSMSFGRPYILAVDGCIHDGWLSISAFENVLISDYFYYILNSAKVQQEMKMKASFGGAVQNLNVDIVKSLEIPIPPLPEQRRIVAILDHFETLVNDLSVGLPAELEARRKQYEYYRDKLLTFDRV